MKLFDNKVALVTGASSGIGHATARLLADQGARVLVAARREAELAALVEDIRIAGGEALACRADVSRSADVERMVDMAMTAWGKLDIAVNNAGIEGRNATILDLTESEWDEVQSINLKSNFLCMKFEAKAMLKGSGGRAIVNVGSVNSFLGLAGGSAYVASKHGQIGLTTSASAEFAPLGIRVNLVCPGAINTPMHQRLRGVSGDAFFDDVFLPTVHLRRSGRSEEIAQSILFLCSDAASYITGTTVTPDGGYSLTM